MKDKLLMFCLILFGIFTIEIFLCIYPIGMFLKIYIPIVILNLYFIGLLIEYFRKKKFYDNLFNMIDNLDEKYLVSELIKSPIFIEEELLQKALQEIDKSMIENVNKYRYLTEDYKEYIELWIHEIKLPIAASKMVIENNKNEVTKSINEELDRVENYIEQALFYARSNTVEKDYYIRKVNLNEIICDSIKKNKNMLIQEKISLNMHDLKLNVYTDSKWIVFMISQIIQNSVKYMKEDGKREIEICGIEKNEKVILYIKDNGIGIKKGEITRVFEKGFTGTNGRLLNKKSTGIGLYLCKKLCDKLMVGIELNSVLDEGTEVRLVFPQSRYLNVAQNSFTIDRNCDTI